MNSRRVVLIGIVAILMVAGTAFGQDAGASASQTDNQILGIEVGLSAGYRLLDGALVVGQNFSLNLSVAQNVQVGFSSGTVTGATPAVTDTYALLKVAYFMTPLLGFNIAVGSSVPGNLGVTTPAIGAGVFFNVFSNRSGDGFSTALKIKLDYLADTTNGVDLGTITFGLTGVFGL